MQRNNVLVTAAAYAALTCFAVLFLLPIFWIISLSFKTRLQTFASPPLLIWMPTLENYWVVLDRTDVIGALINSCISAGGAVALCLLLGVPAAYALERFRSRGGEIVFVSLLLLRMLPPITILLPMFVIFSTVGLLNSRWALVLAYTTFGLPLVVWIMRGFFASLPRSLEESAWVDGASRSRALLVVVLPQARPALTAAGVLALVLAWSDFLFAAVLTNSRTRTLPVLMATYSGGDTGVEWGPMAATGVLVMLPVVLFALVSQRHLAAGLSAGGVQG